MNGLKDDHHRQVSQGRAWARAAPTRGDAHSATQTCPRGQTPPEAGGGPAGCRETTRRHAQKPTPGPSAPTVGAVTEGSQAEQ